MTRITPDQIKPGRSYRLMPQLVVLVNGKEVRMPVRDFAALAVEDVTNDAVGTSPKG